MIKKPDLRIDTEFFDDNLNGLHIPEAIRVTQSIDTQTFIKEGLSDEPIEGSTVLAVQAIQRVISQRLFDNFVESWSKLKARVNAPIGTEGTPYSQRGHRRQSPLILNQSNEGQHNTSNTDLRGFERQKVQFNDYRVHQQSGAIQWLEEQRKHIRSKSVLRGWSQGRGNPAETHYQRAKVLKEIVDKLKHGRQVVTGLIDQFDSKRQNEQLHQKLNKLERLMEDVHYSATQRGTTTVSEKPSFSRSQANRNPTEDIETELTNRLRQELLEVKSEMQKIRRANEQIIREQQWKKAEIMKMQSTHQEIRYQYETLKYQISYLQKEKQLNQINNFRFQQQLSMQNANRQQYERQISFLSQRLNEAESKERQKVSRSTQRPIVPEQANPFGYSTFTTSQKNSNALINNWQQSIRPVQTSLPYPQINQQGRQSADEWACC